MNNLKRLVALVVAVMMVLSVVGAALADAQATIAPDAGVEIIGLEVGDTVTLYKVLEWDGANGTWVKTTAFSALDAADVSAIIGQAGTYDPATDTVTGGVAGDFTPEIASHIKAIYTANPSMTGIGPKTAGTLTDGYGVAWTRADDNLEVGLYMAIITPAANNNVVTYNPVFVACDLTSGNGETYTVVTNNQISNVGYAKKKTDIDLTKVVTDADGDYINDESATAEVGEKLTFEVNTTIPSYAAAEWDVNKISYVLSDSLNGLKLVDVTNITVQVATPGDNPSFSTLDSSKYDLTAEANATTLSLSIKPAYLKEITGPQLLKVTYFAEVTNNAVTNVSATDNKVTLEYSTNPSSSTEKGTKHDVTNHYQFALDAELFGDTEYHTSELVKIGLDQNGKPIYQKTGYSNKTTHSALEGAKFALVGSYTDAIAAVGTDGTLTSDEYGRFLISNLDIGTYFLVETKAPDGYIRDNNVYKIEISADFTGVDVDDGDCTYHTEVLNTYTVAVSAMPDANTVNPIASSTYTMNYYGANDNVPSGTVIHSDKTITLASSTKVVHDVDTDPEDHTTEIKNKQGTPLPSTGGIGTTIFYVAGIVLVLGAAAIIIARRKAEQE